MIIEDVEDESEKRFQRDLQSLRSGRTDDDPPVSQVSQASGELRLWTGSHLYDAVIRPLI